MTSLSSERSVTLAVRAEQIWQDWDVRFRADDHPYKRVLRVVEVDETHATLETIEGSGPKINLGKRSRVKLSRMRPTSSGYKLIRDAGEPA